MSKGKIFMMCLMVLALMAMPLLACGGDGGTEYELTISVDPAGGGTTDPIAGTYTYDEDDEVTITATAASGYEFDQWSGDATGVTASVTITMTADMSVTAHFTEIVATTYDLTMAVEGNGSTDPAAGVHTYDEGTVVDITATADAGSYFVNWTGEVADPNAASTTVTVDAAKTVTANFDEISATTYDLTMAVSGNGSTSPVVGAHTYNEGAEINIIATPDSGWEFDSWTGDVADPNAASTMVTMNAAKTVTATFTQIAATTYDLTMAVTGSGTTSPAVGVHNYAEGTVVNITATAASGYEFANWTGDVADPNAASTTVTMNATKTVTANFTEIGVTTYDLTMAVIGSGTTNPVVGVHPYAEGTVVNITATAASGYEFANWTGDVTDPNAASTTVTMNAAKTVTANFTEITATTYNLTMAVSGSGTTTPAVGVHSYTEGTVVNVTANPASGWEFDSWSGGVVNPNAASTTVTMNADKTVTANFSEIASPESWTYEVTYTDPAAAGGGNTSSWVVTAAGEETLTNDYYSGTVLKLDVDYGTPAPERLKMGLSCKLLSGSVYFDVATNRMMYQTAQVLLGGATISVNVTNEWLDDVGSADKFIAHTQLIGGGPPVVADEYHQVIPAGTESVVTTAGTFTCAVKEDNMIGEGRQINGWSLGTGNGSDTVFTSVIPCNPGEEVVYVAGTKVFRGADYTITYGSPTTITFSTPPASGAAVILDTNFTMFASPRLWKVDYVDTGSPSVGLVKQMDYMYGYPNGESEQLLTSYA